MAAVSTIIAAASLAVGTYSYVEQQKAQGRAAAAQESARTEQRQIQAMQASQERRSQVREERVRRARVMQASQNTGLGFSSGEAGVIGGLSTQLGSNIGTNLSMQQSAQNISLFNQQAANAQYEQQQFAGLFSLSGNIFGNFAGQAASDIKGKYFTTPKAPPTIG